jgi:transcription antitermination factor NusG
LIRFSPSLSKVLETKREFKVGEKVRVNLHHGKIEDAVVRAVIHDDDGIKLQVDVVGLDLTALIDTRQVVE